MVRLYYHTESTGIEPSAWSALPFPRSELLTALEAGALSLTLPDEGPGQSWWPLFGTLTFFFLPTFPRVTYET